MIHFESISRAKNMWTDGLVHAFHVDVPKEASSVTLDFQFLAPAQAHLLRPDMVIVP